MDFTGWNNFVIGKVEFICRTTDHPYRQSFIRKVLTKYSSVLEIGPGELIEYQVISKYKNVNYSIVDVSDVFLENCRQNYPEVEVYKSSMEWLDHNFFPKKFDLVYAACVLEHSFDIEKSIKNLLSVARNFHFVFFKWSYKGDLIPKLCSVRNRYSTAFNINKIIACIQSSGVIQYMYLISEGGIESFIPYEGAGIHRRDDRLIISGECGF